MVEENLLKMIPGDLVAQGSRTLPPAEFCRGAVHPVEIDVPGRFRARVLYKAFRHRHGKWTRWFWAAESAERIS